MTGDPSLPTVGRQERRTRTARAIVVPVVVAVVITVGLLGALFFRDNTDRVSTVEAMFETYNEEGPDAALRHFSTDVADRFEAHMNGLAVWNDELEVLRPCEEISGGSIVCVMWEQHDFHEAAGLAAFTNEFTFRITDGEISYMSQDVHTDVFRNVDPSEIRRHGVGLAPARSGRTDFVPYSTLQSRFRIWLAGAHPDEAARIGGFPGVHGLNPNFDANSAAVILEFVDEFVTQSDDYLPPPPDE